MADRTKRFPENLPGRWYVDRACIDCDLCNEIAPAHFKGNDVEGHSFVFVQPATPEALKLCEEAKASCPVEAIGDDG